ncbi:response regulator transcription factor [Corynebacterium falsenii]|uniref:DNA-binding response regulator n=1 Tax=Corynebacterium falsenii TaxID=108486 RepID=A0A418Q614_9CORY|nr:response regulator transcription factor [Corynebacterium falsenii]AHI02579.1 transcriptional regulator [Corynebacterium falsenii DSM 44353]MDC7104107.1 response regulator transcription factor [Corynebacterium falsenii]RIX34245.1 DNA-binding response regulator [Corynebacterium falsenii]UBI05361.1 response regulator transcription factor [Corynebacterium falsenii]UBI06661.1 response regulator transcription factor [Corynebacterium falsenii]
MKVSVLSDASDVGDVVGALGLLNHEVDLLPPLAKSVRELVHSDLVIIDVTGSNLLGARDYCRAVAAAHPTLPVAVAIAEASLIAIDGSWAVDDFLLPSVSPVELDARIRLLKSRRPVPVDQADDSQVAAIGDLIVDELTYVARVGGQPLDLTYKEFELLHFLVKNAGRVFSREQLLQDVWGYDYFGGARTVDVHVRRLRAKLGHEHEQLIATVRNVGYKAISPEEFESGE